MTTASESCSCAYCGHDVDEIERDHVTGRDERGRYFDPVLWLPSCHLHNVVRYQVWTAAGLDRVAVHPMATRLMRAAVTFDKVADSGRDLLLPPAQTYALAAMLRAGSLVIVGLVAALVLVVLFGLWGTR